jgi:hypothetical protein
VQVVDHMGASGFNSFKFSDISGLCFSVGYLGS